MEEIIAENKTEMSNAEMIGKMTALQSALGQLPGAKFGDDAGPLRHFFADGLYIREYTGIKGDVAISKLHKTTHPFFILKGDVSILTNKGIVRIKAPYFCITRAGTKRTLYFHENTVCMTVHATDETDLERIEDQVIANTYDELPEDIKKEIGTESEAIL